METTIKKEFILEGLCCPNCAAGIERDIQKIKSVKAASLDMASQKLTIEVFDPGQMPSVVRLAARIVRQAEPGVRFSDTAKSRADDRGPNRKVSIRRIGLGLGAALYAAGMLLDFGRTGELLVFLAAYLLAGGDVLLRAARNIAKGRVFDENFLMGVATIGAFALGEYSEGVAVMLFYQVGEAFQDLAVGRSRRAITALMDIRPDYANLQSCGEWVKVAPEEVKTGDTILVKPGEKIPLDGQVIEGSSSLDTSALTGESLPRDAGPGSDVLSGSINQSGVLSIRVTKAFGESTVSKILDLVQSAGSKKAPTENFITKFARYYTPAVVLATAMLVLIPPLVVPGASFSDWLYRGLTFLVVSCPCALVISIPLGFFGGIGGASRSGILVKGSNYLEALNNIDTIVFDKTGTLTKGTFTVTQTFGANGWREPEILYFAAHAESFSNHPIALSIRKAYGGGIDPGRLSEQREISGMGIRARVDGRIVLAGNGKLMDSADIAWQPADAPGSIVYVAVDGAYAGHIVISDELKPDSIAAVRELKALGVRKTAMLTGDSSAAGASIAQKTGLDEVFADLLPHQKVEKLELMMERKASKGNLVFVGDGINDAPVLARADLGIAMGALGADAAIEAADIVLMTDEPSKIAYAVRIARRTRAIVWQNIAFALSVKAFILILAAFGIATMWEAVFGDVGVALIAILNAMRAMRVK